VSCIPHLGRLTLEGNWFVNLIRNKALTVAVIGSTTLAVSVLGLPSQAATSGHRSSHASVQERGALAPARPPATS